MVVLYIYLLGILVLQGNSKHVLSTFDNFNIIVYGQNMC